MNCETCGHHRDDHTPNCRHVATAFAGSRQITARCNCVEFVPTEEAAP